MICEDWIDENKQTDNSSQQNQTEARDSFNKYVDEVHGAQYG